MNLFSIGNLKRIENPTTKITSEIERIDLRNIAYQLAARGEYGVAVQKGVQTSLPGKYPISAAQKDVIEYIATIPQNKVAAKKAPLPDNMEIVTNHIKALGYFLKADLMGTCHVPVSAYYSHDLQGKKIETTYENAIVIVMRKELHAVRASSGKDWMGDPISFQAYQHLGLVAETIANYIRRLGWDARAEYGPSFVNRYSVLLPPLLLAAGIGEVSRAGIILNPFLGLAYKAAVVLTDLPVTPDKPIDFGLQKFCQECNICAEVCPSKAISGGEKVIYNGYETWKLDARRCASFNLTNKNGTMCNTCVKSCPWSNPSSWTHNIARKMVISQPFTRHVLIQLAKNQRTLRASQRDKWWFDMMYSNGDIISMEQEGKNE